MELRHLRYFARVAQELNLTRAASQLHVAQPALSRQIRQLEEELGVALFDRTRQGMRLTDAGRVFLGEAQALLARSAQAVRVAQETSQAREGSLNLGYVWGLFHSLAPQAVARFRFLHPHSKLNLLDLSATQQASALVEGKLDAGFIGFADEAAEARLAKRAIASCEFVAALPAGHAQAGRAKVVLGSLAQDFFVLISEQNYPAAARVIMDSCRRAGFQPRILHTAERGFTMLGLVAANCGVALVPEQLCQLPHPGVVFRPLREAPLEQLFIAWHPERVSGLLEEFLAALGQGQAVADT